MSTLRENRAPRAIVLHGAIPPEAPLDDQDTLVQVEAIAAALRRGGFGAEPLAVTLDFEALRAHLTERPPALVFNLVESLAGSGRLIHLAPTLLEELGLPFTGASAAALLLTSNKLLAKRILAHAGVPTPPWREPAGRREPDSPEGAPPRRWILKSVWEHASLGMDDGAVIESEAAIAPGLAARARRHGGEWFAEGYVEGREFNVSVWAPEGEPKVLPLAEIAFPDFPEGKPRIVGYRAKWEPDSFEYRHTMRRFLPERGTAEDHALAGRLRALALRCWEIFALSGYARVDFRVDAAGRPWVLEVNANPCLSPDAGFAAAAAEAGIGYDTLVHSIARAVPGEGAPRLPRRSAAAR